MKRERTKRSWKRRLSAVIGCLATLIASIVGIVVGFGLEVILGILAGLSLLAGPAVVEGGSVLEMLGSMMEAVADGVAGIFEAIGSLFSGW